MYGSFTSVRSVYVWSYGVVRTEPYTYEVDMRMFKNSLLFWILHNFNLVN
jgi:hypothetical protein